MAFCFANSLPNGFVFDDLNAILKNPDVTDCLLPAKSPDTITTIYGAKAKDREEKADSREEEEGEEAEEVEEEEEEEEGSWTDVFKHDFWGTDFTSVRNQSIHPPAYYSVQI